jgi:Ca-activated chloride channel family protein
MREMTGNIFVSFFHLVLIAAITSVPALAQKTKPVKPEELEQDEVVRVSTTLVTVPVSVKDRHGKVVSNLGRQDFHLYEDGIEQVITYFEPPWDAKNGSKNVPAESTEKPLTVALLLDTSDSTEFKLKQIQEAAIAFADQLRPEDRMLVMAFDKNVRVLTEPTNDRNTLRNAVSRTRTGGGTSLYDAVDSVITWLNRVSGRKAIVLLTDGVDTASAAATYNSTVRAAQQLDAAIYPIQYNTYADFADNPTRQTDAIGGGGTAHMTKSGELASEAYKRATIYLRLLAEKTGGRFEYTDSLKNLSRSFMKIAAALRAEYTLGYYPKNQTADGTARELKVSVSAPSVTVRARKSYVLRKAKQ